MAATAAAAQKRIYSDEGDRILRKDFPAGVPVDVLLARLNACLPEGGRPMDESSLTHRARRLKLYRPDGYRSEQCRLTRLKVMAHGRPEGWAPQPKPAVRRPTMDEIMRMQKPLPDGLTAVRPPRDGGLSTALAAIVQDARIQRTAPCDRDTVLKWGERWAQSCDLGAINAVRRDNGLPEFEIR